MHRTWHWVGLAAMMCAASFAHAQTDAPAEGIAIPPIPGLDEAVPAVDTPRMKPFRDADTPMLTTRDVPASDENKSEKPLWDKAQDVAAPTPAPVQGEAPPAPVKTPFGTYQPKVPFGKAEPVPVIPSGPHNTVAVPVVDVDAIEAAAPAPATPVASEADPAKEDPAAPTELTAPMFGADATPNLPRKTVIRLLNKVTAQSERAEMKMGETVKFGQLEVTAVTCRVSQETSQHDTAALLDIVENTTTKGEAASPKKPLFRGWMYASSPSVTALEHPVYDVTLVDCKLLKAPEKKDEKPADKANKAEEKKAEKPVKKAKN